MKNIFIMLTTCVILSMFSRLALADDGINTYSKAAILMEQSTGRILFNQNAQEKRSFASLTKMMTLLITLDALKNKEVFSDDIVVISKRAAAVNGSTYRLKAGEKVELYELMKGLMIVSGNDAAVAIAEHVGGSEKKFVSLMNHKAKEVGMKDTYFVNPHGLPIYLDNKNPKPIENLSTAKDIALLAKYLIDNYEKEVLEITSMKMCNNPKRGFCKGNTNALLNSSFAVDGLKTGYSGNAGYCLAFTMNVNSKEKNHEKFRVIGVVLGCNNSNSRTSGSGNLLNFAQKNFYKQKEIDDDEIIKTLYLWEMEKLPINLKTKDSVYLVKKNNEKISSRIELENIYYPIRLGDKIGELKYIDETDMVIGKTDLISNSEIKWVSINVLMDLIMKNIMN